MSPGQQENLGEKSFNNCDTLREECARANSLDLRQIEPFQSVRPTRKPPFVCFASILLRGMVRFWGVHEAT